MIPATTPPVTWRTITGLQVALVLTVVAVLGLCASAQAQSTAHPSPESVAVAYPVGHWAGEARLFDRALRQQRGPIPMSIELAPDLLLKGTIGDATWPAAAPVQRLSPRLEYRIKLMGAAPPLAGKDHLVLIITPRTDGRLDADFHLKSRFGLDLGMAVGHFDARPDRSIAP